MKNFIGALKLSIYIIFLLALGKANAQNVGISATGVAPNASAGLDVDFTSKGLLIPRVYLTSTTSATVKVGVTTVSMAPVANSLLIYNLENSGDVSEGYYYNSAASAAVPLWVKLATGSLLTGWGLFGNAAVAANFLGTTNTTDLIFKANSKVVGKLKYSTGAFLIGDTTQSADISHTLPPNMVANKPALSTGTLSAKNELVIRQDGDQYGSSIIKLRNRWGENGAIFETSGTGAAALIDLILKSPANGADVAAQSNIRFEGRSAFSYGGASPEFQFGTSGDPTLIISGKGLGNSFLDKGNFGIGVDDPSASLHLRAGTASYSLGSATAFGAPLKFTTGTFLTSPEVGAVEFNGSNLFYTNSTPTRLTVANLEAAQTFTGVKTFVTPVLGAATAISINKVTITAPATGSTLTIGDGQTFTVNNTLTLAGTNGSTINIGTGGTLGTGAYATAPLTLIQSINFGSTGSGTSSTMGPYAVVGAVVGDAVIIGAPVAQNVSGIMFTGYVSAAGQVTVRCTNLFAVAFDPPAVNFTIKVIK